MDSASSAEDLPHVFEPFYRSATSRRRGVAGWRAWPSSSASRRYSGERSRSKASPDGGPASCYGLKR